MLNNTPRVPNEIRKDVNIFLNPDLIPTQQGFV